jgi:hypothetical protein
MCAVACRQVVETVIFCSGVLYGGGNSDNVVGTVIMCSGLMSGGGNRDIVQWSAVWWWEP